MKEYRLFLQSVSRPLTSPQRKELRHEPEFTSPPLPALWRSHDFFFDELFQYRGGLHGMRGRRTPCARLCESPCRGGGGGAARRSIHTWPWAFDVCPRLFVL